MSSPYGAPGGQQGPGSYGGPGGAPWGPGAGGPAYGGPPPVGPQYGAAGGQGGPGQGFGPSYGAGPSRGQQSGGPGFGPPAPVGPESGGSGASGSGSRTKPRAAIDLSRILSLALGVLGLLAFFFGFLSAWTGNQQGSDGTISVYATAAAYLPILLLLVGLLAVARLVPNGGRYTLPVALLAVVGFLAALTQLISGDGGYGTSLSVGVGLILLLVVSLLQAAVALYAWLTESGILKPAGAAPRRPKRSASSTGSGQAQFPSPGPEQPSGNSGFGAAYPPGAYGQPGGVQSRPGADAPPYSGYAANPYNPSAARADEQRNPYATPQTAQPNTAGIAGVEPTPQADSPNRPGSRYSDAPPPGPSTGAHGRDDGPSPDETQQVRF